VRKLNVQDLKLPERPENSMPLVPADITAESAEELMVLFGEINCWLDYIETQLYAAQVDEEFEKQQLEEMHALEQIQHKGEDKVTTMKAMAFTNDDFLEQRDKAHQAYAYRKMTETIYNRMERARFIVSREITRRSDK
jgi:hypothetical protein